MTPEPYRELEKYFERIVNTSQPKELTMFEKTKLFFTQQIEKINSLLTKPVAFVEQDPKAMDTDYWAFEMYTGDWINEHGETVPVKHTLTIEPHEGTWMDVLDKVIDEMEKHYGYPIKEQVYYSVVFPMNEPCPYTGELMAGYGRMLNDEVFQKLLLSFPEVYEMSKPSEWKQL